MMIRKLKVLGLALVAIFAMGALGASMASAQTQGKLTSTGPVTLDATEIGAKGSGSNAFTALGGKVECHGSTVTGHNVLTTKETEEGKVHGFIVPSATEITLTPDFNQAECRATLPVLGERDVTINMNGCDFVLHIGETIGTTGTYGGTADLVCPTGKKMDAEIYKAGAKHEAANVICTLQGGPSGGLGGPSGKNTAGSEGKADDIDVEGAISGIPLEHSGSVCGTGTENAKFDMNATVTGTNEAGEETGITVSD